MHAEIVDTSIVYVEDFEPSNSAEFYTGKWKYKFHKEGFQNLGSSVGVVQKITTIPNIIRYCQLKPAYCEEWLNVFWEDYYSTIYLTENEGDIVQFDIISSGFERLLFDSPQNTYLSDIYKLQNVRAIIFESIYNVKHFITILDKRDIKTREKIYEVEMKMFEQYPDEQFKFSIYCIQKQQEIELILKNKEILYYNI